jgi:hypothetical protein
MEDREITILPVLLNFIVDCRETRAGRRFSDSDKARALKLSEIFPTGKKLHAEPEKYIDRGASHLQ